MPLLDHLHSQIKHQGTQGGNFDLPDSSYLLGFDEEKLKALPIKSYIRRLWLPFESGKGDLPKLYLEHHAKELASHISATVKDIADQPDGVNNELEYPNFTYDEDRTRPYKFLEEQAEHLLVTLDYGNILWGDRKYCTVPLCNAKIEAGYETPPKWPQDRDRILLAVRQWLAAQLQAANLKPREKLVPQVVSPEDPHQRRAELAALSASLVRENSPARSLDEPEPNPSWHFKIEATPSPPLTPQIDTRRSSTRLRAGSSSAHAGPLSVPSSAHGGPSSAHGGLLSAQGGLLSAQGGLLSAQGGLLSAQGGLLSAQGGLLSAQGGPSSAHAGPSSVCSTRAATPAASSARRSAVSIFAERRSTGARSSSKRKYNEHTYSRRQGKRPRVHGGASEAETLTHVQVELSVDADNVRTPDPAESTTTDHDDTHTPTLRRSQRRSTLVDNIRQVQFNRQEIKAVDHSMTPGSQPGSVHTPRRREGEDIKQVSDPTKILAGSQSPMALANTHPTKARSTSAPSTSSLYEDIADLKSVSNDSSGLDLVDADVPCPTTSDMIVAQEQPESEASSQMGSPTLPTDQEKGIQPEVDIEDASRGLEPEGEIANIEIEQPIVVASRAGSEAIVDIQEQIRDATPASTTSEQEPSHHEYVDSGINLYDPQHQAVSESPDQSHGVASICQATVATQGFLDALQGDEGGSTVSYQPKTRPPGSRRSSSRLTFLDGMAEQVQPRGAHSSLGTTSDPEDFASIPLLGIRPLPPGASEKIPQCSGCHHSLDRVKDVLGGGKEFAQWRKKCVYCRQVDGPRPRPCRCHSCQESPPLEDENNATVGDAPIEITHAPDVGQLSTPTLERGCAPRSSPSPVVNSVVESQQLSADNPVINAAAEPSMENGQAEKLGTGIGDAIVVSDDALDGDYDLDAWSEQHYDDAYDAAPLDVAYDAAPLDAPHDAAPLDAPHDAAPLDAPHDAAPLDAAYDAAPLDAAYDAAPLDAAYDATLLDAPFEIPVPYTPLNLPESVEFISPESHSGGIESSSAMGIATFGTRENTFNSTPFGQIPRTSMQGSQPRPEPWRYSLPSTGLMESLTPYAPRIKSQFQSILKSRLRDDQRMSTPSGSSKGASYALTTPVSPQRIVLLKEMVKSYERIFEGGLTVEDVLNDIIPRVDGLYSTSMKRTQNSFAGKLSIELIKQSSALDRLYKQGFRPRVTGTLTYSDNSFTCATKLDQLHYWFVNAVGSWGDAEVIRLLAYCYDLVMVLTNDLPLKPSASDDGIFQDMVAIYDEERTWLWNAIPREPTALAPIPSKPEPFNTRPSSVNAGASPISIPPLEKTRRASTAVVNGTPPVLLDEVARPPTVDEGLVPDLVDRGFKQPPSLSQRLESGILSFLRGSKENRAGQ